MINKKILAYIKLILVILIWAGVYHIAKYLTIDTDAFTLAFLRFFTAGCVLLMMYFKEHGIKGALTITDNQWSILWLISLVGVFGYNILFFGAESIISANDVAIFFAFSPCLTVIFSKLILKHEIHPFAYVGIVIALLGTVGVITLSHKPVPEYSCLATHRLIPWGQILAISTAFVMALYNVFNKKACCLGLDALTITTFSALMGTLFLFISFLLFGGKFASLMHKPLTFWAGLGYISILATVVAYKWYSEAIRELGVGQTAVFLNGIPLFTVLIGITFLGNVILPDVMLSGIIIIIGVVITNITTFKSR